MSKHYQHTISRTDISISISIINCFRCRISDGGLASSTCKKRGRRGSGNSKGQGQKQQGVQASARMATPANCRLAVEC